MRTRSHRVTRAAGVVALAFTLALALGVMAPTAAHAASGCGGACSMTVTLGSPVELLGHVNPIQPVIITCTPPANALPANVSLGVDLNQAVGTKVASADGFTSEVPCDGSLHTITVTEMPFTPFGGAPLRFHGGTAVASASAFASFVDAFGNILGTVSASDGPRTIKIAG